MKVFKGGWTYYILINGCILIIEISTIIAIIMQSVNNLENRTTVFVFSYISRRGISVLLCRIRLCYCCGAVLLAAYCLHSCICITFARDSGCRLLITALGYKGRLLYEWQCM